MTVLLEGMAKDVKDYIQQCPTCRQEKAQVQSYPLHMTEIPDRPFNKIAMDLVTDFTESSKGNKHILTTIDLLTGWPEAIPIPNKSADTVTKAFICKTLPTQTYVPQVHTIRQWHGIQEPDFQQSDKGSRHQKNILCTIPPSEQWETRNIPQISQTNTKENVC